MGPKSDDLYAAFYATGYGAAMIEAWEEDEEENDYYEEDEYDHDDNYDFDGWIIGELTYIIIFNDK